VLKKHNSIKAKSKIKNKKKILFNNHYIPVIKVYSRNMVMDQGTYW